jgi:hypothetical protein
MASQADGLFRNIVVNPTNFENDAPRLDNSNPMVYRAFTATHTGFGWLGGNWLVWKHAYPHLTTALHKTGQCDTSGLDLTSL